MAKLGVMHAFQLIPVRPEDWHLLGFEVNRQIYVDVVLLFGSRSSPYLFCTLFSLSLSIIQWIIIKVNGNDKILVYEDFFICAKSATDEC